MEYRAGTLSEYTDSMAEKMRMVFEDLWREQYGYDLPSETRVDRRMLFVAIAQGVIQHLKDNAVDAFDIDVTVEQRTDIGPWIESSGQTGPPISGTTVHRHDITVTQDTTQADGSDNKVKSSGSGKDDIRVNILTTGDLL